LSAIAESRYQMVTCRSLHGRELKAWLMLPVDYQPGRRYPAVVWV
jgi:dipeptidyl aminopeptidase/acylaminoacyl peptidase